jgi:hypothetical protein
VQFGKREQVREQISGKDGAPGTDEGDFGHFRLLAITEFATYLVVPTRYCRIAMGLRCPL